MVSLLLALVASTAQAQYRSASQMPPRPPTHVQYLQCKQACVDEYSGPGYELRQCLSRCEQMRAMNEAADTALGRERENYALRCKYEPALCQ